MGEKEEYFKYVVDKYSNMVYRLALSRTANIQNAEDIYQEVFYRLSKKMPEFESVEHEKAWLIKVTINCANNFWKSNKYCDDIEELKEKLKFETPEKSMVYYAVMELPTKYRIIIHLYYYENYKINEICEILHIKEGTIKSCLSRAREKLKEKLQGGDFDE